MDQYEQREAERRAHDAAEALKMRHFWYRVVGTVVFVAASSVGGCAYFGPQYNVYKQRMDGEAELAQANYSKQVQVQDAKAKEESAQSFANAEVIRAHGVAQANAIIGDSLKGNDAYLRYLWINKLSDSEGKGGQVIYVPTEAGLPILEAGRLDKPAAPK